MEEPLKLAATFLEHVPAQLAVPNDAARLEGLLRRAWETGRNTWPHVALPADVFVRHMARRLSTVSAGPPFAQLIEQLALADLYLACACLHQLHAAIATLESHYLAKLPASLRKLKLSATRLDEVCQTVRIHLLLGTTEAGPQLAEYTGRGALLSWIRVIAVRMAITQGVLVRETSEENILAALEVMPTPEPDPEFDLIKRRYHREFGQAMREAFAAVSNEQRRLLRLHFIDQLSTTEMGTLFRVNQSTVSRWIKSARQAVYEETKRRLQDRLGLTSREFLSLLVLIDSQLDLSISQVLKEKEGGSPPPTSSL